MMKIKKTINVGIISWASAKFSELKLQGLYGWQ